MLVESWKVCIVLLYAYIILFTIELAAMVNKTIVKYKGGKSWGKYLIVIYDVLNSNTYDSIIKICWKTIANIKLHFSSILEWFLFSVKNTWHHSGIEEKGHSILAIYYHIYSSQFQDLCWKECSRTPQTYFIYLYVIPK